MLEGNKYTVALMKEGIRPFRISSNVGQPVPIPWTASGRLLLSHLSDREILDFIPAEDFTLPIGDRLASEDFLQQVREAAAVGHFTFNSAVDTFTHCFAVPVFGGTGACVATLCLVTPREDGLRNHAHYLDCLKRAAADLSARLGHAEEARNLPQRRQA
jgi:DNA-binding IclR family transcriptional regulator